MTAVSVCALCMLMNSLVGFEQRNTRVPHRMNKNIINFLTDFQFRTAVSRLSWALGACLEILLGQLIKTNHAFSFQNFGEYY